MNTPLTNPACPKCGRPIPREAREGLCPSCALEAVAAPTEAGLPPESRHPPPARETVAAALPQFEILELIGQGGMGSVFKARQPQLNRLVALKILPTDPARDPKFNDRFLREAQALARLNHPNIVTVHDFGQAGDFLYLVMEYVDGASLRQLLRERRLLPEEALAIVPRICEALQFAHEQGVLRSLEKEPERRYQHASEVRSDVETIALTPPPKTGDDTLIRPARPAPRYNPWEVTIVGGGTLFFLIMLSVVVELSRANRLPLGQSLLVMACLGLGICVLSAAGWWPFPSPLFPEPNFSSRNLQRRRSTRDAHHAAKPDPAGPTLLSVIAARWTARILGTLFILFLLPFILAEGLPPLALQPEGVQLTFIGGFLLLLGFILGWWREGTAAVIIACGWTVVRISENKFHLVTWFELTLVVAALYAFCWWATRGQPTRIVVTTTAVLAATLAFGRLFSSCRSIHRPDRGNETAAR